VEQSSSRHRFWSDTAILAYLALFTAGIQLLASRRYGIFRDELYYLACGEHLDWGYVDQPPFCALMIFLTQRFLGESLLAIRFLPAVCGALTVFLTGWITRELGGGRFAQVLDAFAVTVVSPHAMSYETNLPIYVGRDLKVSLKEVWPRTKGFI
jgi:hypothetical protein